MSFSRILLTWVSGIKCVFNSDEVPDGLCKPDDIQDGLCKMWEEQKAKTEMYYDSLACSFLTITFGNEARFQC